MFAMIGQRDSGKGTLMLLFLAAFGSGLVNTGLSANNLLASDSNTDEAKKFMWLRDVTVKGSRLVWTNEIGTMGDKGSTFVDGNLVKGIAKRRP